MSFPVSAVLVRKAGLRTFLRYQDLSRVLGTRQPGSPIYQRLFELTYLSRIYHIATFTTSLRVIPRDYSSSPKTNLRAVQGSGVCNSGCAACLLFLRRRYLGGTNENNICMRPPTLVHQYARGCTATDPRRRFVSCCLKRDGPKFITSNESLLRSESYLAKPFLHTVFLRRFPDFRIYLRKQDSIFSCAKETCNKAKHCSKSLSRDVW